MVHRFRLLQIVENRNDLRRCNIFGSQAVPAAVNVRAVVAVGKNGAHVFIQRFALRTGLFGAVQHSQCADGLRQSTQKIGRRKRAEQPNLKITDFAALLLQEIDDFLRCAADRAHGNDYIFCIRCAVIIEKMVVAPGDPADFTHVLFHNVRDSLVIAVGCLTRLEVDIRVLDRAALNGVIRVQGVRTERFQGLLVHQGPQVFVIHDFNLLDLVRSAEPVKEMQKRDAALNGSQMRHGGQIHDFLDAAVADHGKAGLPAGHYVRMIPKNGESVSADGPGTDMQNTGKQLAAEAVQGRDHQHQPLRSGIRRSEGPGLQSAMHSAGCPALAFHLYQTDRLAEKVLLSVRGPDIHMLRHRRRRRDRVNGGNFRKRIRNICGSFISVHGFGLSFHCHPYSSCILLPNHRAVYFRIKNCFI